MQFPKDFWFAEPVDSPNEFLNCKFCDLKNHTSNMHKCGICGIIGTHSAIDHCSAYSDCNILFHHVHSCEHCSQNHETKDHVNKCYCNICRMKGHTTADFHYDCNNCNSIIINNEHIKCSICEECTYPDSPHIVKCNWCNSCCIDIHQNHNYTGIIMCTTCHRVNQANEVPEFKYTYKGIVFKNK